MHRRGWIFWVLCGYFGLFLAFLYGSLITMFILSFQGPEGGVTFPMRGLGLDWWRALFSEQSAGIFKATGRSFLLGLMTGAVTALFSCLLAFAFRRRFRGRTLVFFLVLLGIMTPGILLGFGVSLLWRVFEATPYWLTSGFGVHVVWSVPFGFLVMMAVMNRFDPSAEEAARDLGAGPVRTFLEITLPLIATGILGAFLFGFTLSWNEFERSLLVSPENTLPLEIFAEATVRVLKPSLYALGGLTALITFGLIAGYFVLQVMRRRI